MTRAANAFHTFGVTSDHPVAFVLPNLPETHFTIWGGETAGVVLAINPMLEPSQIAHLLRTARVRVLVTLAPGPEGLWAKISGELVTLPDLRVVAWVDMTPYLDGEEAQDTRGFADAARSAVSYPQTISSRPERSKRVTHHRIFALAALPGCPR